MIQYPEDIKNRLVELAQIQAATQVANAELQEVLDAMMRQVNDIKAEIRANEAAYEDAVQALKDDLLAYTQETGDRLSDIHEVTLRRRTVVMYDGEEALRWAQEHAPEALKVTLDKRAFEKVADRFEGAERVTVPEIALSTKLGHLLIGNPWE